MKNLVASVTLKGELKIVCSGAYKTKQAFYRHLREDGYRIRFIANEETFEKEAIKYNEMCIKNLANKKVQYKLNKLEKNSVHS